MNTVKRTLARCLLTIAAASLAACSPGIPGNLGGTITGLTTGGLTLANGTDTVSPGTNATTFTFTVSVKQGATYSVTVQNQPTSQVCTVTNGSGTMGTDPVKNVTVTCAGSSVATLAGSGTPGSANGTGKAASFNSPIGIATDSQDNAYVADANNNLIRRITSAGAVSTLAGSGSPGSADASGNLASFNGPSGVAVSSVGNIYVADAKNNLIRMVTQAGVVTTFAGSGAVGAVNATGTAASFSNPTALTVDAAGNVYVADTGNNLIRKIDAAGVVTTLAGSGAPGSANGSGTAASFNTPTGIGVDAASNVFVADKGNNLIREIAPDGTVKTLAGSGAAGAVNDTGAAASFSGPAGVAVSSTGNVYVADGRNNLIRRVAPDGTTITLAGSGAAGSVNGTMTTSSFNNPTALAVNAAGNVYIADTGNNLVRLISFQ